MMKKQFFGQDGVLLPNAIQVPKGEEIAISNDWVIYPEAISGEGKVWTIDGRLEPIQKQDNEMWVCTYQDQEFKEPLQYKTKNNYNWHVVEVSCENELDYVDKKNIQHLILSNNLKTINDKEFFECSGLKTIKIPDSVTYIGNESFRRCNSLRNIIIPDSITDMGNSVFSECRRLRQIALPENLKELRPREQFDDDGIMYNEFGFFEDCEYLEDIKLPANLEIIGARTFYNCYYLQNLQLPNTLKSIGDKAFSYCSSLKSLVIPNSVDTIDSFAFYDCTGLKQVILPESLLTLNQYMFFNCYELESINIPTNVTKIDYNVFENCSSLHEIVIPGKVLEIGEYAFDQAGLRKLTIGKNVTHIGYRSFACENLQTIISYAVTPPMIDEYTFDGVDRSLHLVVPDPELYRSAEYWKEFYNIYTINPYKVTITSANEEQGRVTVELNSLEEVRIIAIAKDGFYFKQWSDGITESWRSINPTGDINLVAEFEEPYQCEIVNLEVIDSTPTSVTVRFEVTCNEERDTLNSILVDIINGEFSGNVVNKPGIQETTIEGLQPETMYQIRVAAMNNAYDWVDRYIEFTTPSMSYTYVDLGLPSGTLWADRNIGADNPEDTGLLFQWGDTIGWKLEQVGIDKVFDWDSYWDTPDSGNTFTKYQYFAQTLNIEDDAAYVNMGKNWKTPGTEEINELLQHTTPIYVDINNIEYDTEEELQTIELKGVKLLSKVNDSSIFIPLHEVECLWVAKLFNYSAQYAYVWGIYHNPNKHFGYDIQSYRYKGHPIRGVANIM